MKLLNPQFLVRTCSVDHADWNYRPVLGWIQRLRFHLIVSMLRGLNCHRLLEVGYGSGVFMPELKLHCQELWGIDIHHKDNEVRELLAKAGVDAKLFSGTIEATEFRSGYFDIIVAVSSLEFVENIDAACVEINRLLNPQGFLIMVTPGNSKILDFGLRIFTGESAEKDYEGRRGLLMPALEDQFVIAKESIVPPIIGIYIPLYKCLKLSPKDSRDNLLIHK